MKRAWKNMGDLATFVNGYAFKPTDWSASGAPIIRIQNLTGSMSEVHYYAGGLDEKYRVHAGDILISWSASIGVYEWKQTEGWLNQHIFKVVFDKERVNQNYFKYAAADALKKAAGLVHGSTMKHLTKKVFDEIPVAFYDAAVQEKIVAVLQEIDGAISNRQRVLTLLDELVRSRFVEMFGNKNYEREKLKNLCKKITDGTHKTPAYQSDGIPFVSAKNIKHGKLLFDDIKYITQDEYENIQKRCDVEKGDLLITKSGSLGMPALVDVDFPFGLFESLAVLKYDREKLHGEFLKAQIESDPIQHELSLGVKGITIRHLHLNVIGEIGIFVPPLELQNQFADFVHQVDATKSSVQAQLTSLTTLRAKMMQDFFG